MSKQYVLSPEIKAMPEAAKLEVALDRLLRLNVTERLHGNCIAASDIIQNILDFYGINSKITECQVFVAQENRQIQDYRMVGFNTIGLNVPNIVDTHVVVITQTTPPLLIDASIGYLLPEEEQVVVKPITSNDPDVIGEFDVGRDITVTYHHKKNIKLPALHQKNIIERLEEEKLLMTKMTFLQKVIYALIGFASLNFILNSMIIFLKLTNP